MDRAARWVRSSAGERVLDGALCVVVLAIGLGGHVAARLDASIEAAPLTAPIGACAALAAGLLWWRRRYPLLVLAGESAAVVAAGVVHPKGLFVAQVVVVVVVVCFAIGAWSRRLALASIVLALLLAVFALGAIDDGTDVATALAFALAVVAMPSAWGYAARARRRYVDEVERRLVEAERDRDERARHAIADERRRIARELHDVVAHHVSLIGVQAGAARTALLRSPDRATAALAAIEASSREAVGEMRRLLDVLRPDASDGDAHEPQPGLDALGPLVARWRAAGVAVTCDALPSSGMVPDAAQLCCYRIVEESLTNVARHCRSRRATVSVAVDAFAVTIAVRDDGPAVAVAHVNGTGRGLAGMRERVALFGGTLHAGPTGEGGFAVHATIPYGAR